MIRLYIERNGGAHVFESLDQMNAENVSVNHFQDDTEEDDTQQTVLPIELRMNFVNYLADFTVSSFGMHPTESQLKNIAQCAVALVPLLASKGSDSEIVIIEYYQ